MSDAMKDQQYPMPYFSCQNDDCAAEVSFPAGMLSVFDGSPICETCYGDIREVEECPEWSDLPDFVPDYEVRYKELCEQVRQLESKNAELKSKTLAWFNSEDCWIFQDDGDDYPESLACPVVMSAEKLRELMSARDENERLMDKIAGLRNDVLEEIENRDAREDRLNILSNGIAGFFGIDIGEHSSINCPWDNAFEAIPVQTLRELEAQWQAEAFGIAAQICDAEASIHNITGHPNSEMLVAIHCAEKIRQLAKGSSNGE